MESGEGSFNRKMIGELLARLRRRNQLKEWRRRNSHNSTTMSNEFAMDLVHVGRYTYGELTILNFSEDINVFIGDFCSIASGVVFAACSEHRANTISTFPFKVKCLHSVSFEALSKGDIVVEDDVWIGQNAIILSGVRIGQGAIVAAGTVVTKDVPPYAIVGGNPGKIIKYRFEQSMIDKLLEVDFSKLDYNQIEVHIDDLDAEFKDINQLTWLPKKGGDI